MQTRDISNQTFGYLTALHIVGTNKWKNKLWLCRCTCGNEKIFPQGKLVQGRATNCGCKTTQLKRKAASKHGITAGGKPRTFIIWCGMKARCNNPKSVSYKSYGARGIEVCDEWMVFENFHKWALANGYEDGLEIDRIDANANYCPSNCRWVTPHFNRTHQRKHRKGTV